MIRIFTTVLIAVFALLVCNEIVRAQSVPQSKEQIRLSYAPLVKTAAPAVVNIYTKRLVERRAVSPFFNDPFFERFFGGPGMRGPMRKRVERSLGSGVIVQSDGLIVSNAHVINQADEIKAVLSDGREFDAELILSDDRTDLAVLRIDPAGEVLPFLKLGDSDELEVGDLVLAIGNPFGVGQTVTSGIVSAAARTAIGISDFNFFIQTDAAINPGNSGGALVAMDGRLVGVNTAIFSKDGGSLGIGFAVPANMVRTVIAAANNGGKVQRPWMGLSMQSVTSDVAESIGLGKPRGAMVNGVMKSGPADQAGIKVGDVVLAVNDKEVLDPVALRFRVSTMPIGSKAVFKVFRKGKIKELGLTLIVPPENPPRNTTQITGRNPLAGATVVNVSPAVIDELGLDFQSEGVVVSDVDGSGNAARFGVRPTDGIIEINDEKIKSVKQLVDLFEKEASGWKLTLMRDGKPFSLVVSVR